jgi:predicted Zn-dependent protease
VAAKSRKEQIEEMLKSDPADPFLNYGLAMEYVSAGDDAEAARRFEHLFTVAPHYVPAYLMAGQVLVRLNRPDAARDVLQRGLGVAQKQRDQHAWEEMQALLDTLP